MALTRKHIQGGRRHATPQEQEALTRKASRTAPGLMPATTQFEGMWQDPPAESNSPGAAGMRAFDQNYFYYHTGTMWKRKLLEEF